MTDPNDLVLYLIVRESLCMSGDKIAIQCSNGIQKLLMHYFLAMTYKAKMHNDMKFPQEEIKHIKITTDWLARSSKKVILKATEDEWMLLKNEYNKQFETVRDYETMVDTVICLWPQHISDVSNTIKNMKVL